MEDSMDSMLGVGAETTLENSVSHLWVATPLGVSTITEDHRRKHTYNTIHNCSKVTVIYEVTTKMILWLRGVTAT